MRRLPGPSNRKWLPACRPEAGGTCTRRRALGLTRPPVACRRPPRCTQLNRWQTIRQTIRSACQILSWVEVNIFCKTRTSQCCRPLSLVRSISQPLPPHHHPCQHHRGRQGATLEGRPVTARTAKKPKDLDLQGRTFGNEIFTAATFPAVARCTARLRT